VRFPPRIVLTGGPGGGKTSFVQVAHRYLDFKVVVVPETARGVKEAAPGGRRPRSDDVDFQLEVLRAQLAAEAGLSIDPREDLVLLDRGVFDSAAFIGLHGYRSILDRVNLTEEEALLRYDGIVFVRSAATLLGAAAIRRVTADERSFLEHVRDAESKLLDVVRPHENLEFVEAREDFDDKCRAIATAVESVVSNAAGVPKLRS
jgi:predicted ATPase